jgi:hypothetical protein
MEQTPPAPLPVIPIKQPSRVDLMALLIIVALGITWAVFRLIHPPILQWTEDDTTTYCVDPRQIKQQIAILIVSGVCAIALITHSPVRSRFRKYGGGELMLVLAVALVLWHQGTARIIVTPDSLTAPRRSRLFPGEPATVRFEEIATLQFHSGNTSSRAGTSQTCYKKDKTEIDLDFGVLGDEAVDKVAGYAREHRVKVRLPL